MKTHPGMIWFIIGSALFFGGIFLPRDNNTRTHIMVGGIGFMIIGIGLKVLG